MPIHARILIVARDDERAGPLAEGLDRLGWRTVTARGPFAAIAALGDLQIEAAIVDLIGVGHEALTVRAAAEGGLRAAPPAGDRHRRPGPADRLGTAST